MIHIDTISKNFLDKVILQDLSLSIKKGEIIGLAGPSGSGKSTLLRCIQGLETVDSGSITCNGLIGFLFQDFQLFPHMTVLENILYTPHKINKLPLSQAKAEALRLLTTLEILEKALSYPKDLSGGQKQRVALARMLIVKPDTILCDEPTSGLDRKSIKNVSTLLSTIATSGITMVLASHDLDFLNMLCTRVLLLKNGSIILDSQNNDKQSISSVEIAQYY